MNTLYEYIFSEGDYKATFIQKVDELTRQDLTDDFKVKIIQALTDAYINQTGKVPDSYELSRLATWLVEDKTNDPDKVTNTEYPILSEEQYLLRRRRELIIDHLGEQSTSSKHKLNGKRSPKSFKVFGEYEGGY